MEPHDIVIRCAGHAERPALELIAGRDSKHYRGGAHLVAEVAGSPVAALPVAGGPVIADPFRPTAAAVALLELRRAQLWAPEAAPRRRRRLAAWLRRPAPLRAG